MAMNTLERTKRSLLGGSQRSKIQRQLLLLLLLSTALPVAIVGSYGVTAFSRVTSQALLEDFEEESVTQSIVLDTFLNAVKEDIEFLAQSYQLQGFVRAEASGGSVDGLSSEDWEKQLTGSMVALMAAHPEYQQIQVLDNNGVELVRVSQDEAEGSVVEVTDSASLQDVSDDEHIVEILNLEPDDLHVSRFELGHEDEVAGDVLIGGAHVASAVFDRAGNRRGVVVTNVFSERVVGLLEEAEENEVSDNDDETLFLVDAEGYYIHHPDESKMWGAELGHDNRLQKDYTEKAVEQILAGYSGVVASGSDLLAYAKVDADTEHEDEHFYVVEALPKRSVYGPVSAFRNVALLVALTALAVALPLGILRGRQLI